MAAESIGNPSARELFLSLSEIENEHEKTFISFPFCANHKKVNRNTEMK